MERAWRSVGGLDAAGRIGVWRYRDPDRALARAVRVSTVSVPRIDALSDAEVIDAWSDAAQCVDAVLAMFDTVAEAASRGRWLR